KHRAVGCSDRGGRTASGGGIEGQGGTGTMNIVQRLIPAGRANRPGRKITPTYITVHETDNTDAGADAERHAKYLAENPATAKKPVSWHFTVDDKKIVQ